LTDGKIDFRRPTTYSYAYDLAPAGGWLFSAHTLTHGKRIGYSTLFERSGEHWLMHRKDTGDFCSKWY